MTTRKYLLKTELDSYSICAAERGNPESLNWFAIFFQNQMLSQKCVIVQINVVELC
jgi:hypothetical protein